MKIVYIAGPYRAMSVNGVIRNIAKARECAALLTSSGIPCICPHMNTALLDELNTERFFLESTMEVMRRCDAVFVMEGSESSKGTVAEMNEASRIGKPVFFSLDRLSSWYFKAGE